MGKSTEPKNPLNELLNLKTSERLLLNSFEIYKLKKNNILKNFVFGSICIVLSYFVGVSENTVSIFGEIIENVLSLILALFGISFTGYTFFQALINGRIIELLIIGENEHGENKFTEINESFVKLMMLYIFIATISFLLKVLCTSISNDFGLTKNLQFNNSIAILGIFVYLYISLMAIWHIKSFVYNIFQLFNMHAVRKYLDLKKEEKENTKEL